MADMLEKLLWPGIVVGIFFVTTFWVWMLVECAMKEVNRGGDKLRWLFVILCTHWVGAVIYFFVRRPQRIREVGQ